MSNSCKLIDVLDLVQPMPDYQIYQAAGRVRIPIERERKEKIKNRKLDVCRVESVSVYGEKIISARH